MMCQIRDIEFSLMQLNCFGTDVAIDLIQNHYYGKDFEMSFSFNTSCSKCVANLVREYTDCEKLKYRRPSNGRSISVLCQRRKKEIIAELSLLQDSTDIVGADIALYCVTHTKSSRSTWKVFMNSVEIIDSVAILVDRYIELTLGQECTSARPSC